MNGREDLSEQCLRCGRWVRPGCSGYCAYHHLRPEELTSRQNVEPVGTGSNVEVAGSG